MNTNQSKILKLFTEVNKSKTSAYYLLVAKSKNTKIIHNV